MKDTQTKIVLPDLAQVVYGDITIDTVWRKISGPLGDGELTRRQIEYLEFYIRHDGKVVSQRKLFDYLYATEVEPSLDAVKNHVCSTNKVLRQVSDKVRIKNVPRKGYKVVDTGD